MEVIEKPRIKVVFQGRDTKKGAYTQYHIFSLRSKREIHPHRTEQSKTGHHWDDIWYLFPARYFISYIDITNSGKHHCGYACLNVREDGYELLPWEGRVPKFAKHTLCHCLEASQ